MTITVYKNFSKRKNSTKQPTGGTSVTCTLKESTSVEKPTFVLSGNDFTINYVKAFGHYYFVEDIRSVRNGLIEISCSMDVLATHKSDIQSYTAFVERSASNYNVYLADPLVTMYNDENIDTIVTSGLSVFNSVGIFVISCLSEKGSGSGFTTYYIIDVPNLKLLADYCNNAWNSASVDFGDWIQSTFLKTSESIIDCIWVPFNISNIPSSGSYENVTLGIDDITTVSAYRITGNSVVSDSISASIPHTYNDFRKGAPYSICRMMIPGYGMVDINPLDFASDIVHLSFDIDWATGDVACYIKNNDGKTIGSYTYNVAVPCPVGKTGANVSGTVSGVLSTGAAIAGAIAAPAGAATAAAGIGATASGINTLATAVSPTNSVHGAKGGRALAETGLDVIITTIEKVTSDPDDLLSTHGRPWMGDGALSGFSGYVQCSNASVPISGMGSEKDELNGYLNSGFYIE